MYAMISLTSRTPLSDFDSVNVFESLQQFCSFKRLDCMIAVVMQPWFEMSENVHEA